MSNSDQIHNQLQTIKETASKNTKVELLKEYLTEPLFERVLLSAYDPLPTYGIQKKPEVGVIGKGVFDEDTFTILEDLAGRVLSGNNAITAIKEELERLTPESAELFWNIIIKDLKAGFGAETINKAKKGLIQTFPYMRCSLISNTDTSKWEWDRGIISQEKADGMFANVNNEHGGIVTITSRQGSVFPTDQFLVLEKEMQEYMKQGMQYHGEFLVKVDGEVAPREIGNGIMNSVLKGGSFSSNQAPLYVIWDTIPLEVALPKGKHKQPYYERLRELHNKLVNLEHIKLVETRTVHTLEEAYKHYTEMLSLGKEGTVLKKPSMEWKDGTSKEQIKLKLEVDVDLEIVSVQSGKVGTKVEGLPASISCKTKDGLLQVDVTVKNEAVREDIRNNLNTWIGSILVVRANELTSPSASNVKYSLFLPRMVETSYREDKYVADTLEEVIDQFNSARGGKSAK